MIRSMHLVILGSALVLIACSAEQPSQAATTMRDSAGVAIYQFSSGTTAPSWPSCARRFGCDRWTCPAYPR